MDINPKVTLDFNEEWSADSEEDQNDLGEEIRCADVASTDLDKLDKSGNELNKVRQANWALNLLLSWLKVKNVEVDFKTVKKTELNAVLRRFYGSIRTTKGELYSINSYLGLRAGLNRYINEPPVNRSWNIMQDADFITANNVFKEVLKEIRAVKNKTHHPPISPEDQQVLKSSTALSPDKPKGLLNKVWYDIQLHFGHRGKQRNRDLKPDSFILKYDDSGAKYFTMSFNEKIKNLKDPLERDRGNRRGAMYEERGDALCPVASLQKYLSKIPPDAKALYLQPKREIQATDSFWYTATPVGVNQLSQMLPRMCQEAGTHSTYTNHSMRATAIQKLSDARLKAREIMALRGCRSSVLYQATPAVGADGKNVMRLVAIPRRYRQPSPTQAAVLKGNGQSCSAPTPVQIANAQSFPAQIPVLRTNLLSRSTLTTVQLINAQFFPTQMPILRTNGLTCSTETPVHIVNEHSFPFQVAFQRTNDMSSPIKNPVHIISSQSSTSGQPSLTAAAQKVLTVYNPLLLSAAPPLISKPVSAVNVSPSQRDSLHKPGPQQQPVTPSAKRSQAACPAESPATPKSSATNESDVHEIVTKSQVQSNDLSNGRSDVKDRISSPSAGLSARESSTTVVCVSPGNTRDLDVTQTIGSAAETLQRFDSLSNTDKTLVFKRGSSPQTGASPKLKLIPKLSKRPNSPTRWVIEEIDGCTDEHGSKKPSSESASSGNPASFSKKADAPNESAPERPWVTYDGRLFYVTKKGGSSSDSPAATQPVPSSSLQPVKSAVSSADEVIDLCGDDGSPSSNGAGINPGDEDNVIFLSYVPPKSKSGSAWKEQLDVSSSNSRTDVLPPRDGGRVQNVSVSQQERVPSPAGGGVADSLTTKGLERIPEQQLVTMETGGLANTNEEETSPTVKNSDQRSFSASEPGQRSDHQLRNMFGITADVKVGLQRVDEMPAHFPHNKSRVPADGGEKLRVILKDKVVSLQNFTSPDKLDVKVLTKLEQCVSKENCCSGVEMSFSPEAESAIGYVEPIDEDFPDENSIPQSPDTHGQTQKCGDVEPNARRVGRTRKRTMCLCCVPSILHPIIKSATTWEEVERWTSTIEGMSKEGGKTKASRKDGRTSTRISYPNCKVHKSSAGSGSSTASTASTDSEGLKRHEQIPRPSQHQAKKQHK